MVVLVTGVAGFIGSSLARALLAQGREVIGLDRLDQFPSLSRARLASLLPRPRFRFVRLDLAVPGAADAFMKAHPHLSSVVHLAGRGGVRASQLKPEAFVRDNIQAQTALLNACKALPALEQVIYASSSAVYGYGAPLPFVETAPLGAPGSFYAVTKRTNELTAEVFARLEGFSVTGVRFFTVYGPWGRPDMACWKFASAIKRDRTLTVWDDPALARDFTYIDDAVSGLIGLLNRPAPQGVARVLNLGKGHPDPVAALVSDLSHALGKTAHVHRAPRPAEDLPRTWAHTARFEEICGWRTSIGLSEGVSRFAEWFQRWPDETLRGWEDVSGHGRESGS